MILGHAGEQAAGGLGIEQERVARVLYLPRYSPDLNPIRQLFAKPKALIRKAAARRVNALWAAVADILRGLGPGECRTHLAHAAIPS